MPSAQVNRKTDSQGGRMQEGRGFFFFLSANAALGTGGWEPASGGGKPSFVF